jgi:hypothetical protein
MTRGWIISFKRQRTVSGEVVSVDQNVINLALPELQHFRHKTSLTLMKQVYFIDWSPTRHLLQSMLREEKKIWKG